MTEKPHAKNYSDCSASSIKVASRFLAIACYSFSGGDSPTDYETDQAMRLSRLEIRLEKMASVDYQPFGTTVSVLLISYDFAKGP